MKTKNRSPPSRRAVATRSAGGSIACRESAPCIEARHRHLEASRDYPFSTANPEKFSTANEVTRKRKAR